MGTQVVWLNCFHTILGKKKSRKILDSSIRTSDLR